VQNPVFVTRNAVKSGRRPGEEEPNARPGVGKMEGHLAVDLESTISCKRAEASEVDQSKLTFDSAETGGRRWSASSAQRESDAQFREGLECKIEHSRHGISLQRAQGVRGDMVFHVK